MKKTPEFKLQDIAEIQLGTSFRSKLNSDEDGEAFLVQMKDLNESNSDMLEEPYPNLTKYKEPPNKSKNLIRGGDILFRSKGTNLRAVLIENIKIKAYAVAPLYLIRADLERVSPKYLLWFLNHPNTQNHIMQLAEGTSLMMFSKKNLEDLLIKLPSKNKQNQIIKLMELQKKEEKLTRELISKRRLLFSSISNNFIEA